MFSSKMQYTPVSKLSGGEKRRLGLMMVLIRNPNFLILDEPTNDLDLLTLNKLEEFLLDFGGCLILVSHDRFFMDKLVEHYFVFEGEGEIRDHNGSYQEYRQEKAEAENERKKEVKANRPASPKKNNNSEPDGKASLNYSEQKEYQKLEKEISKLEDEKAELEKQLGNGSLSQKELEEKSTRYGEVVELTDKKTLRWLELADKSD